MDSFIMHQCSMHSIQTIKQKWVLSTCLGIPIQTALYPKSLVCNSLVSLDDNVRFQRLPTKSEPNTCLLLQLFSYSCHGQK